MDIEAIDYGQEEVKIPIERNIKRTSILKRQRENIDHKRTPAPPLKKVKLTLPAFSSRRDGAIPAPMTRVPNLNEILNATLPIDRLNPVALYTLNKLGAGDKIDRIVVLLEHFIENEPTVRSHPWFRALQKLRAFLGAWTELHAALGGVQEKLCDFDAEKPWWGESSAQKFLKWLDAMLHNLVALKTSLPRHSEPVSSE